jgi:hypothetical protein
MRYALRNRGERFLLRPEIHDGANRRITRA